MICGQEHFQLKNCKFRIANTFSDDLELFFKPAVKSNSSLGKGRPKGGLFMAWKKSIVKKSTRISSENFRIQAAILEFEDCKLLLINTYFPCDSQNVVLSNDEAAEIQKLLSETHSIKDKYSKSYDTSIVLGDMNYDDNRYTGHTLAVNNFLENERLCSIWESHPVDFTFSSGQSFSTISFSGL